MRRAGILVVDDEPMMTALIERALGSMHDVLCVHDGEEALALLYAGKRFDVVLCDLAMRNVGGALVYFETALLAPEQAKRFVFMTGGTTNESDEQLIARAMQPTLAKPFGIAELRFVVDGMLTSE